jgi:hypothetical protein
VILEYGARQEGIFHPVPGFGTEKFQVFRCPEGELKHGRAAELPKRDLPPT